MDSASKCQCACGKARSLGRGIALLGFLFLLLCPFNTVKAAKGGQRMAVNSIPQANNSNPGVAQGTNAQNTPETLLQDRLFNRRFETALRDPLLRERFSKPAGETVANANDARELAAWRGLDSRQGKALSLAASLTEFETGRKYELRQPIARESAQTPAAPAGVELAAKTKARTEAGKTNRSSQDGSERAQPTQFSKPKNQHERNEMRQAVSRETAALAPARQALSRKPRPAPAPYSQLQEADQASSDSELSGRSAPAHASLANTTISKARSAAGSLDTGRRAAQAVVTHPQPMPMQRESGSTETVGSGFPVMPLFPPTPLVASAEVLGSERGSDGFVLASGVDGADSLRLPVSRVTRRSVAHDMLAENKARKLLTEEAKKVLLPVTGELSAVFESGKEGIACIGYDRMGGTSYGKYQISSRTGTMKLFLDFLDERAPEWSLRLRKAGPANTNSRWGGMASEWKKIAAENSTRFESLQDEFILRTNYSPALNAIAARTKIDVESLSPAIREVLWSTAVQHGPNGASNIFANAVSRAGKQSSQSFDKDLIEEVYRIRKTGFKSSSPRVRNAVKGRLVREQDMALSLLEKEV